jgi:putative transposase
VPRQLRYRLPGYPQHVVQRGNNRQRTFFTPLDYGKYRAFLARASAEHGCAIHAYVLMTNHVHLLVTPAAEDALPELMQSIGRRYVRHVNDTYGRSGTLWEGRYKACLVQTDGHLLACYRYIELNPVRAGIVENPATYRYSSFRGNALGQDDPLVTPHATYLALGADPAARCANYRSAFCRPVETAQTGDIRRATSGGRPYGDERFIDDVGRRVGREVRAGKPGRRRRIAV